MQKAFDILDWEFILEVLRIMQLPNQFIKWIRGCITNSSFSISINGGLVGYFKGEKGG